MKIFIVTEGGKDGGFGHITRCSAIFQAFKEKGVTAELIIKGDNSISDLLKRQRYRLFNWHQAKGRMLEIIHGASIVIVDSYAADISFYKEVSKIVKTPVYMDDTGRLPYPRGIVVNSAIYADKVKYPKKKEVIYLLGTRYAPLRKIFWRAFKKIIKKKIENVLVTFGGNDLRNMVPKILRFLKDAHPELSATIVAGSAFKNIKEIISLKSKNIRMVYAPDSGTLKRLMQKSDIAISAGGQTLYELARMGVPTIALTMVENQADNMRDWKMSGFIEDIGWWDDRKLLINLSTAIKRLSSRNERIKHSDIGSSLIDGKGANRIVETLLN